MNNPIISLEGVEKRFGSNLVVKKMNLEIAEGEFLTLLGPSGCGKTTKLRMIAGFEEASAGVIKVEGERIEDKEPFQRNVNTVFQNYALFIIFSTSFNYFKSTVQTLLPNASQRYEQLHFKHGLPL